MVSDATSALISALKVVLPARSILEKSGLMVNRAGRLQYCDRVIDGPVGAESEWRILDRIAKEFGSALTRASADRDLTLALLNSDARLSGLSIASIKRTRQVVGCSGALVIESGIDLASYQPVAGMVASHEATSATVG